MGNTAIQNIWPECKIPISFDNGLKMSIQQKENAYTINLLTILYAEVFQTKNFQVCLFGTHTPKIANQNTVSKYI